MTEPHGNIKSQLGNKNASKGKENHTSNIHLLMTGEQKGLINRWSTNQKQSKKCAPNCLEALLIIANSGISLHELKSILENLQKIKSP